MAPSLCARATLAWCGHGLSSWRRSRVRQGDYSLSIKYQIVKHIKINFTNNRYDIAPDAKNFATVQACGAALLALRSLRCRNWFSTLSGTR